MAAGAAPCQGTVRRALSVLVGQLPNTLYYLQGGAAQHDAHNRPRAPGEAPHGHAPTVRRNSAHKPCALHATPPHSTSTLQDLQSQGPSPSCVGKQLPRPEAGGPQRPTRAALGGVNQGSAAARRSARRGACHDPTRGLGQAARLLQIQQGPSNRDLRCTYS